MTKAIDAEWMGREGGSLLFEAWLILLGREQLGLRQWQAGGDSSSRTFLCGDAAGAHFAVTEVGLEIELETWVGVLREDAVRIIDMALAKVASRDFGGVIVYQTEFAIQEVDFVSSPFHFIRTLGDQVHVEGSRRLSDVAVLEFPEALLAGVTGPELILVPPSKLQVTLFVAGPVESVFTEMVAAGLSEMAAATVAFATGRPVKFEIPGFALEDDASADALARQFDVSIPTLARNAISLDIFGDLAMIGQTDATLRARGALLAYHSALQQSSPDVAVMLLVTSMEALIAPRPSWGKDKVTSRFISAIIDLCPDAVDEIIEHGNVAQAFGYVKKGGQARQRKEILDLIYEARSIPTHTGPSLARSGMFDLASTSGIRVALLSDLARAALLSYLKAPRSFLYGNPAFERAGQDP